MTISKTILKEDLEYSILLNFAAQVEEDRDRLADAIHPGWSGEDPTERPSIDMLVQTVRSVPTLHLTLIPGTAIKSKDTNNRLRAGDRE